MTTSGRLPDPVYRPQLDALRAFAIVSVLVTHFLPPSESVISRIAPWGSMGVRLFFVLSGFLITGILLRCRSLMDSGQQSIYFTLRQFYFRRFLRIFPAFYFILAIVVLCNVTHARESVFWHAAYVSNFYFSFSSHYSRPTVFDHFWSLAVEEQFYAIWPLIVLFASSRLLRPIAISAVFLGPVYRLIGLMLHWSENQITILPFACTDSLGLGALLAMSAGAPKLKSWLRAGFGAGCILLILISALRFWNLHKGVQLVLQDTALALIFTWLVNGAAVGFAGFARSILESRPALLVGKVSYGIYVYHLFVIPLVIYFDHSLGLRQPRPIVLFLTQSMIAFVIAIVSWYCLERPINAMKRYFPYRQAVASTVPVLAV